MGKAERDKATEELQNAAIHYGEMAQANFDGVLEDPKEFGSAILMLKAAASQYHRTCCED